MAKNKQIGQIGQTKKVESIKPEYIDGWLDWMLNNRELAKKEYPVLMKLIQEKVKEIPSFQKAAIMENVPSFFNKWKNEIDESLETTKAKKSINT